MNWIHHDTGKKSYMVQSIKVTSFVCYIVSNLYMSVFGWELSMCIQSGAHTQTHAVGATFVTYSTTLKPIHKKDGSSCDRGRRPISRSSDAQEFANWIFSTPSISTLVWDEFLSCSLHIHPSPLFLSFSLLIARLWECVRLGEAARRPW